MKKGFTIIELLAVVVVLSVILLIAIPKVMDIVEETKTRSHLKNEDILVTATKEYMLKNNIKLPLNIGQTKEVTYAEIKAANNIGVIRDPYDKSIECNGYVLVTKKSDKVFEYTPHIKCGQQNGIGSSSADGLIANWKFNDFQEPTINVSLNDGQSDVSPWWGDGSPTLSIIENNILFRGKKVTKYRTGSSGNFYINGTTKLSPSTSSTNWTSSLYIKRVDGSPITSVGTYMYITNNSNVNTVVTVESVEDGWYKVIRHRTDLVSGYPTLVGCYNLGAATEYYISEWMVEPKGHFTSYVVGTSQGVVKDYSINSNVATLGLSSTPKWIGDYGAGEGLYYFNGVNQFILLPAPLSTILNGSNFTLSAWVKSSGMASGMSLAGIINLGYGLSLSITSNGNLQGRMDNGSSLPAWSTTGLNLHDNQSHHVVMTYNGSVMRLYVDGVEGREATTVWNNRYSNAGAIGYEANNPPLYRFRGEINDVYVYNRALSEDEIKRAYKSGKHRGL